MKQYKPIATYSTAEDIISLFPNNVFKGDEADIIYNYFKSGQGEPRLIIMPDKESYFSEEEVAEDMAHGNFLLTRDKLHGVRFIMGIMQNKVPYGYYIDIYEAFDDEEDEPKFTDEQLKVLSRERREMDARIKSQIIKEFKARFKEPGEGLDFFEFCGEVVYGMLDETGDIGRMYLDDAGNIVVELGAEYEDPVVEFQSQYFACDDWPQLLRNVRRGIRENWLIEDEDYA